MILLSIHFSINKNYLIIIGKQAHRWRNRNGCRYTGLYLVQKQHEIANYLAVWLNTSFFMT